MALRVSLWQSSLCKRNNGNPYGFACVSLAVISLPKKKKNRNGARQRSLRSRFKLFTKLQTARHSLAAERNKRLRLHLYIWSNCVEWLMCLSYFQVCIVWQKLKKKKKGRMYSSCGISNLFGRMVICTCLKLWMDWIVKKNYERIQIRILVANCLAVGSFLATAKKKKKWRDGPSRFTSVSLAVGSLFWQQKKKNGEMAPLNRSLVRLTSLADLAVSILLLLLPLLLLLLLYIGVPVVAPPALT